MDIIELFNNGSYSEVLKRWDQKYRTLPLEQIPLWIGALSFMGRIDDAQDVFEDYQTKLSASLLTESRFYLAIGLTRLSRYEDARTFIGENLKEPSRGDSRIDFFKKQGIGFYRFYAGRFKCALKHAQKSLRLARKLEFSYGTMIAMDLTAHTLIRLGDISKGMELLHETLRHAKMLGATGVQKSLEVSQQIYLLKFGRIHISKVSKVESFYRDLPQNDRYSKSLLALELGQYFLITGDKAKAKSYLDQASVEIYAAGNRRQEMLVNLKYAYIHYLGGEYSQALNQMSAIKRLLEPSVDRVIDLQRIALEIKILEALNADRSQIQANLKALEMLTYKTGEIIAARTWGREKFPNRPSHRLNEDLIGDLIDRPMIHEIIASGFLSFLIMPLKINPNDAVIVFELEPHTLCVFDSGSVSLKRGISEQIKSLIFILRKGQHTKEEIFRKIWKLNYHPLKHDALLYQLIKRTRTALGDHADWITVSENGYSLNPKVRLSSYSKLTQQSAKSQATPIAVDAEVRIGEKSVQDFNLRQLKILQLLEERDSVNVKFCRKHFEVSEVTAFRDLSGLVEEKVIIRLGRARATQYVLARSSKSGQNQERKSL